MQADPLFLRRLLTMLAHAQGGMLNASSLGASLGVSHHTITRHLDILGQTFLLRRLPAYFRTVGKRLVKASKVYLRDSGLLHHLLILGSLDDVRNHPVHGASWETFVLEAIKIHAARVLERAMGDVGAKTGWILDQADGTDALRPGLARRSFAAKPEWLP